MLEVASDDPPAKVLHDVISRIGGTLLVLLSSAARVTPGWLAALHNTAATHPRAGIVGPLVLYPNLNIAEAGSIVHESGLRRFAYRGRSVLMVSMMHVRSVDFFSGMGAVMVNKAVFLDLVRDVDPITDMSMLMFDVSMKFLHAGYRTILQPFSVVIIPYNSARSVLTCRGPASMKQFQNFVVDRYPDVAKNHCPSSCLPQAKSSMDAVYSSMLGLSKVHMLYLDEIVPETDRDSGSIRLFEMLRVLRHTLDIDVTFQSMQLRDVKYLFPVLNLGINVVPRETLKRAVGYFARATRSRGFCPYDVILMARVDVAKYFYNPIKALCPDAPIIFDTVDIVHIREQRLFDLGLLQANLKKSRERKSLVRRMNSTKHMELFFLSESQVSFVVSTFEYKALLPMFQDSPQRLRILSNIYPEPAITEESPADFARRSGALFVGNMCHHPNSDAVKLISQQVLTELRLSSVDALNFRMHFVVSNLKICPNTNLMESIANNSMIVIHRDISDETLYELHRQVRLFLAPLRAGAGVKGKLNMALWLGLPIIASSMASEGMGLVDGESMMLASTSKEFADAVSRLYGDFDMWSRLRRGGYEINKKFYSRGLATKVLNETLTYLGVMGKPRRGCLLSSNRSAQILQEDTEGDAVLSCLDANAVKGFPFVAPFDQYSLSTHIGEIRDASNGILQQNATTVT
jgi:glycosyltransferase involved in cell wall biosynthesis